MHSFAIKNDYPVDVYYSIYKYISHNEFPIVGCWKLSPNSKKAIIKLKYDTCPHHKKNDKKINKKITECDICHIGCGYMCCEYYAKSLLKCDTCSKLVCTSCSGKCDMCYTKCCTLCCITGCYTCFKSLCFKCDKKSDNCNTCTHLI